MINEKYLTVRWNNWLSLGLGIPTLVYFIIILSTSAVSETAAFIGLVIMGAVY